MAIQIQFRRGTAAEWSSVNPILAEAEMGIETDTDLFKIGNGSQSWNDLDYGGIRGFTGSIGFVGSTGVGNIAVQNVLYVSKSGDDSNDGQNLTSSKLTIKSAVSIATIGTTIFVKSGDYTEDNPIVLPEGVSIVGDNLRTVTVRPANITQDLFWVKTACYLEQMTFKDHEAPAAAVAFPTDGSAGVIHTSPYVQNCTSMTTTGTGMRVDGAHVNGLKSMVVDAFTQYNQGGIGIHMLNRGNTQLVSVFTICTDIAFLCESGGFCSITNSNSSFGNFGLKSDGVSNVLYQGLVNGTTAGRTFTLDNLVTKPNVGDAVSFVGVGTISQTFTVVSVANPDGAGAIYQVDGVNKPVLTLVRGGIYTFDQSDASNVTHQIAFKDGAGDSFTTGVVTTGDVGTAGAQTVITVPINAPDDLRYYCVSHGDNMGNVINVTDPAGAEGFFTVATASAFTTGATEITYPSFSQEAVGLRNARTTILDAKSKLQVDTIDFLNETYPTLDFNQFKCSRDVGYIIDAVADDLVLNTNYKSRLAGISYQRATASVVINAQLTETIAAINFVKTKILEILLVNYTVNDVEYTRTASNFDIVIAGLNSTTTTLVFTDPTGVTADVANASDILQANKDFLIEEGIAYITANYPELTYDQTKCRQDISFIVDAVTYDVLYNGNSQTADAADEYYSAGTLQIELSEKTATIATFNYIKSVASSCVTNDPVTALNSTITQNTAITAASSAEALLVTQLFDIVVNIIENAYTSIITLEESAPEIVDDTVVTFHQYSLITASGHTFEFVGSGTNVNTALPYLGGTPITENQVIQINGGKVYFTGTDQRGDFRIGEDFVINQNTGTISGRTFTKSLFAVMTPYILAIGD